MTHRGFKLCSLLGLARRMWSLVEFAAELVLFAIPPLGIALAIVEAFRSRPLTPSPTASFVLLTALIGVLGSYALFILSSLEIGILGVLASYPPRTFVVFNAGFCIIGFVVALLARGRFRLFLSISSLVLLFLWLGYMTPLSHKL